MKATRSTTAAKALAAAGVAFLIALCLSAPVQAKDIELEPYGFAGTSTSVSATQDGDAAVATATQEAAVHGSASHESSSHGERAAAPADAAGLPSSFFAWLHGMLTFGG
jgi:hypothetical protein